MQREILIAEDERIIRKAVKNILEGAGYLVREASDGHDALAQVREKRPDLVLLDIMMPLMDGRTACEEIRKSDPDLPIVFLTALDSPDDEIKGLKSGGDDYISKTARDDILLARVASALRRSQSSGGAGCFAFGSWTVDPAGLFMTENATSEKTFLSDRELAVLRAFCSHPNEIFSRDYLAHSLAGGDEDLSDETLTMSIVRLRAKLKDDGRLIRTVRGAGYEYIPR